MDCQARLKRSREYFPSSNSFYKSPCCTELIVSCKLSIIQRRKLAPYFLTPYLSFHSLCLEMDVKCFVGIVLVEDRFQLAIRNNGFFEPLFLCTADQNEPLTVVLQSIRLSYPVNELLLGH